MKTATYIRFAQLRTFWRGRNLLRDVRLETLKIYFRVHRWTRERKQESSLLMRFGYATAGQLIFAFFIAAAIGLAEVLGSRFGLFAHWPLPNSSDYISFMGTVAQIAGVFIALYYTALTSVAASVFVEAPSPVRNLLVGEQVGSLYMRYLAFVTFFPLMLMALTLLGIAPFHFGIPIVVMLAAIGVLLFARLGQQAFNLFDPTSLALGAFSQFNKSLEEVRPHGFRWLNQSFQDYARRNAAESLEAIGALYDICFLATHLKGRPLQKLVSQIVQVLIRYQSLKGKIPPSSYWFERTYSHPSWYLAPDYAIDISQKTGTAAQPEIAFDLWWVEKRIEPLLMKYLRLSLQQDAHGAATEFLETVRHYLNQLVSQFQLEHALEFAEAIGEEIKAAVTTPREAPDPEYDLRLAALAEHYGALTISLLLQFSATTAILTPERIRRALTTIKWSSEKSIYLSELPTFLIPRLEWLRERIQFEKSVEGRVVTPLWYQAELVNQVVAEQFAKTLPTVAEILKRTAVLPADFVPDKHQVWFAAGLLRARWEFLKKVPHHTGEISKGIGPFLRPTILQDLPWPSLDLHEYEKSIDLAESGILLAMTKVIALMMGKPRLQTLPDYRGQFLQNLAEALLSVFQKNSDDELIKKVFPVFFVGSMVEFETLKPESSNDRMFVARTQVAFAPIFDLIEISGQALVFAELHDNSSLWEPVKSTWDRYFDSTPSALKQMSFITTHGKPQFAIPPRALIRTGWSQALSHVMMQIPGAADGMFQFARADKVQHRSPLIRYLASRSHEFGEVGSQVFLSLYLWKRAGAEAFEWPRDRDPRLSRVFDPGSVKSDEDEN